VAFAVRGLWVWWSWTNSSRSAKKVDGFTRPFHPYRRRTNRASSRVRHSDGGVDPLVAAQPPQKCDPPLDDLPHDGRAPLSRRASAQNAVAVPRTGPCEYGDYEKNHLLPPRSSDDLFSHSLRLSAGASCPHPRRGGEVLLRLLPLARAPVELAEAEKNSYRFMAASAVNVASAPGLVG
jgi:hypothetical protein